MTRDEAIHYAKCLKNNWTLNLNDLGEFCDMAIEALERKRGEWMYLYEDNYKCSVCGSWWYCTDSQIDEMNYCPSCGCAMRERREDE